MPKVLGAIARRLRKEGLGDVKLIVAEQAVITNDYVTAMLQSADLMSQVGVFSFHTYGADIRPDGVVFYVDGHAVYRAPGTSTGLTNIIISNFVYDKIPPAPGTIGVMRVDYVRAWQR